MKSKKRSVPTGLFVSLIIILVVFISYFYFQSSKSVSIQPVSSITTDQTVNWKEYKNDLYTIKFPWTNAEVFDRPSMPNFTQGFPFGKRYKSLKIVSPGDLAVSYLEIQSYIKNDYGSDHKSVISSIFSDYIIRSNQPKNIGKITGNEFVITNPKWPRVKENGGLLMFVVDSGKYTHFFFTGVDYELDNQSKPILKVDTQEEFENILSTVDLLD
ncbi:MAG: hypothetical protein NUV65_06805 [Candidatus Roizmanbacteria bacterium]|nr:hypothetical protein [Candidatus Roizmanbacteria bacterium]